MSVRHRLMMFLSRLYYRRKNRDWGEAFAANPDTYPWPRDPCTCTDPMCPRHRGLVRDGRGAWRRPRR